MFRIASLICAVAATGVLADAAWANPPVAVVDMVRLIEEHPDSKELDAKFKRARDEAKKNAEAELQKLEKLAEEIQLLPAGDPQQSLKRKQYEMQRTMTEFNVKWAEQVAIQDYARSLELLYRAVANQVRNYARENSISMVLQKRDLEQETKSQTPEDFGFRQRLRLVVYSAPDVDITEKVLAAIKKSAGGVPPGDPPAGGQR